VRVTNSKKISPRSAVDVSEDTSPRHQGSGTSRYLVLALGFRSNVWSVWWRGVDFIFSAVGIYFLLSLWDLSLYGKGNEKKNNRGELLGGRGTA